MHYFFAGIVAAFCRRPLKSQIPFSELLSVAWTDMHNNVNVIVNGGSERPCRLSKRPRLRATSEQSMTMCTVTDFAPLNSETHN